jgi:bacteriocin-like protein
MIVIPDPTKMQQFCGSKGEEDYSEIHDSDCIEITDKELDEIYGGYANYERIEHSYINHGLSDNVLSPSQYLHKLIELKQWTHGACPHCIGDFHDKDRAVTMIMRGDCDLCKNELKQGELTCLKKSF